MHFVTENTIYHHTHYTLVFNSFTTNTCRISYSYTNTIASKIFNYKATLRDFDLATFISDPPSCSCDTSCFNYVPVGHVVTGDLSIIKNDKLRSLMSK